MIDVMWRRLSYVYVLIGAGLVLGALVTLWPIRDTPGLGTQLRINIGSNLIDLVLAVLVLQPAVVALNRNVVRRRNSLDYRDVIQRIERAQYRVDIWKFWTGLLEPPYERAFIAAVHGALERDVRFRIMLTDPASADAAARGRQTAPTDAVALIRQNIDRLDALIATLPAEHQALFAVGISPVGPAHAFYRVDDWLSYGRFGARRVSENQQREVQVHGDLGALALEAFDGRWNAAGLHPIADHCRLHLRFTVHGEPTERDVRYVLCDDDPWVALDPRVALDPPPDGEIVAGETRYRAAEATPENRARATALFQAKYGHNDATLLRLTARPSR
ncbi:hypothetical protein J2S43_002203 [Catenuloplanes nepalensis]|uniref:Uncharacterized protein n=1 Tax=Catenuloplanes nepalensis TaxID=587533 RepID=A0ABT9MQI4_9ACTN|nr:hypothetical protein [Catenuloplanes nepalensis]MDP9793691.1 hypothetical protein [Catenuloplanes nepalensis]